MSFYTFCYQCVGIIIISSAAVCGFDIVAPEFVLWNFDWWSILYFKVSSTSISQFKQRFLTHFVCNVWCEKFERINYWFILLPGNSFFMPENFNVIFLEGKELLKIQTWTVNSRFAYQSPNNSCNFFNRRFICIFWQVWFHC